VSLRTAPATENQGEAEKPFWISFSDLMTALMVLFLVAMAVAIHQVKRGIDDGEKPARSRIAAIEDCMQRVQGTTAGISGVTVHDSTIDFGSRANFQLSRFDLSPDQVSVLRRFVPQVLAVAGSPSCKAWLKRVVVDGFASREGTYLRNLDLSIQRSERVLCVLLDPNAADALGAEDRKKIQKLFFVGGSSFNSLKEKPAESRRIEMRLEFYDLREPQQTVVNDVPLDQESACPIDRR
jgi:outer membrane protein OmpA-like peptidoglycan-associated protein